MNRIIQLLTICSLPLLLVCCNDDPVDLGDYSYDFYPDQDNDGFGVEPLTTIFLADSLANPLTPPMGYSTNNDDCDDFDENINPDAGDIPDNDIDENCDGIFAITIEVFVSEIMVNPNAVEDANGEWFEIYNASAIDLDLSEWTFSVGENDFTITEPITITSGGFLVLGKDADTQVNGGVDVDIAYGDALSLNNDESCISINYGNSETNSICYNSTWPLSAGASMILSLSAFTIENSGNVESWCTETTQYGNGDLGSPGKQNSDCP